MFYTKLFNPSTYSLLSLLLTHSFIFDENRLNGHCPSLILSNNSPLGNPSTSIVVTQVIFEACSAVTGQHTYVCIETLSTIICTVNLVLRPTALGKVCKTSPPHYSHARGEIRGQQVYSQARRNGWRHGRDRKGRNQEERGLKCAQKYPQIVGITTHKYSLLHLNTIVLLLTFVLALINVRTTSICPVSDEK